MVFLYTWTIQTKKVYQLVYNPVIVPEIKKYAKLNY